MYYLNFLNINHSYSDLQGYPIIFIGNTRKCCNRGNPKKGTRSREFPIIIKCILQEFHVNPLEPCKMDVIMISLFQVKILLGSLHLQVFHHKGYRVSL